MSITSFSDRNSSNSSGIFELVGSVIRYFTGAPNPHVVDTVARIAEEMQPQFENWSLLSEDDRGVYEIFGLNELFVKRWGNSVEKVGSLFDMQPFNFTSEEESIKDSRAKRRAESSCRECL